jgi:hypothetical protein
LHPKNLPFFFLHLYPTIIPLAGIPILTNELENMPQESMEELKRGHEKLRVEVAQLNTQVQLITQILLEKNDNLVGTKWV